MSIDDKQSFNLSVSKAVPSLVEGMYLMGKAKFLSGELQDLMRLRYSTDLNKHKQTNTCLTASLSGQPG